MGPETASLFVGIASFVSAWAVLSVMGAKRKTYDDSHQFERKRREAIRKGDFTYRNFEPAIDELALSFVNIVSKEKIEKVAPHFGQPWPLPTSEACEIPTHPNFNPNQWITPMFGGPSLPAEDKYKNFCLWLSGYLEAAGDEIFTEDIRTKLEELKL